MTNNTVRGFQTAKFKSHPAVTHNKFFSWHRHTSLVSRMTAASPLVRLGSSVLAPRVGVSLVGSPARSEQVLKSVFEKAQPMFLNVLLDSHTAHHEEKLGELATIHQYNHVFVSTHLQPCKPSHVHGQVKEIQKRLGNLRIDHLSLPSPFLLPGVLDGKGQFDAVAYFAIWHELEALFRMGAIRSIGVIDLTVHKLQKFLPLCHIPPALLQAEMHPFMPQVDLLDHCKTNSITVAALAPLAAFPTAGGRIKTADNTTLGRVANDLKITVPQAMVRWALSRGTICLPRTTSPAHLSDLLAMASISAEPTVRHGRMLAGLNRHQRLHRGDDAAAAMGLAWHQLWDELPLDANGIPLRGSMLCSLMDLPDNSARGFGYPGALHSPMFLVRKENTVTAFLNRCPHLNTALDVNGSFLDKSGQHVMCATHGALFQTSDGLCLSGPCKDDSLVRIPVHVRGGHVIMGDPK
eukprot:m.138898 g.138898  ORF g.138898 m.138898 type:complete len:464 (+) comp14929_c0_seq1:1022-2413(+)